MQLHRVGEKDNMDQILYTQKKKKDRERKGKREERGQQHSLVGLHTTLILLLSLSFYLPLGSFLLAFTRFLPLPPPCFHSSFPCRVLCSKGTLTLLLTVLLLYPVQRSAPHPPRKMSTVLVLRVDSPQQNPSGFKSSQGKIHMNYF